MTTRLKLAIGLVLGSSLACGGGAAVAPAEPIPVASSPPRSPPLEAPPPPTAPPAKAPKCPEDIDACAALAASHVEEEDDQREITSAAAVGCKLDGATAENRVARGRACIVLGKALRWGKGIEKDEARSLAAFDDGCKLGNASACSEAASQRERDAFELAVKTNIGRTDVKQSMMANGRVTLLSCRTDAKKVTARSVDPFRDPFEGPLEARRDRLDACAKDGPVKMLFLFTTDKTGKIAKVKSLAGTEATGECVVRALLGAKASADLTCVASTQLGENPAP